MLVNEGIRSKHSDGGFVMKTFLLAVVSVIFLSGPVFADTFRCKNVIFSEGDTRLDVLLKCGEPDYEEVIEVSTTGERDEEKSTFAKKIRYVVEWHYNCGEREFTRIITFEAGRIISIREGDKGTGDNPRQCR